MNCDSTTKQKQPISKHKTRHVTMICLMWEWVWLWLRSFNC